MNWQHDPATDTLSAQINPRFSAIISKQGRRNVVEFVENRNGNVSHVKYTAGNDPVQAVKMAERIAGMM